MAKLIEALFNTSHLSDVGCTYRLFDRESADRVAETMTVGGSHAGAEILLLTIVSGARFVEVPVNYLPRVGVSSVTGEPLKAIARRPADDPAHPPLPATGTATAARGRRRSATTHHPPRTLHERLEL